MTQSPSNTRVPARYTSAKRQHSNVSRGTKLSSPGVNLLYSTSGQPVSNSGSASVHTRFTMACASSRCETRASVPAAPPFSPVGSNSFRVLSIRLDSDTVRSALRDTVATELFASHSACAIPRMPVIASCHPSSVPSPSSSSDDDPNTSHARTVSRLSRRRCELTTLRASQLMSERRTSMLMPLDNRPAAFSDDLGLDWNDPERPLDNRVMLSLPL